MAKPIRDDELICVIQLKDILGDIEKLHSRKAELKTAKQAILTEYSEDADLTVTVGTGVANTTLTREIMIEAINSQLSLLEMGLKARYQSLAKKHILVAEGFRGGYYE